MDRRNKDAVSMTVLYLAGLLIAVWLALLFAPYVDDGLIGILEHGGSIMDHPFTITLCRDSRKTVLVFSAMYTVLMLAWFSWERNYRRREEYGSARWGDPASLNRRYADKDSGKNLILTQSVSISFNGRKHFRNLNVLVIGGSGAGKSRSFALPNVLSGAGSMVILDPKGELLRDTGKKLEGMGFDVKILDLITPERSHGYNPFNYLHSDEDVQRLTTNLFNATSVKGRTSGQDPFWDNAAMMLLKALVFYLYYKAPADEQNFAMVMTMIRAGAVEEDANSDSALDELFGRLEEREPEHIAVKYYKAYRSGATKTLKSIQITLLSRLEKFNLRSIAAMTNHDEMELDQLGERKMAIFAIIPDSDTSFNFLVSTLYTQLFQQLYRSADFVHNGRLPVHVTFIMDEFANVSVPDDFDKLLATMRSREISVAIIIQNLSQLKKLFEKEWESITGNCDTLLYLGCNEQSTHEYISKMLGKETIDTNTFGRSRGRSGSYSTNYQETGRELLLPDEVRMMDNRNALLLIRGERPIRDLKYDLHRHPHAASLPECGGEPYRYGEDTHSIAEIHLTNDYINQKPDSSSETAHYMLFTEEEINIILDEMEKKK